MILLEAMGAGRPFVATPVGDVPALAGDGGTLVPLNDAAALADALVSYLADPRLAQEVGERGRERCARERGIERVSARISALYERAATSA
jgi:glycosyltransferase involved in cell wall biosynthesis